MSDEKKSGIFVSKKASAASAAAPTAPAKPKDVQRRWLYVAVGFVGVVIVSSSLFGGGEKKAAPSSTRKEDAAAAAMVSVTPKNADKDAFEANFAKDMAQLKAEQERVKTELESKDKQIAELKAKPATPAVPEMTPGGVVPPPIAGNTGGLGAIAATQPPPPPPTVRGDAKATPQIPLGKGMQTLPDLSSMSPSTPSSDPLVFEAPSRAGKTLDAASPDAAAGGATGAGANARVRYQKNANAGMLPAGAFASVALLNGLDAGTSSVTQNNPMPVLMNVTDQATLPGAARYRMKSCFVLGSGYGDLSAERVYVRFARLSCVDKENRLILSQEVAGYLVDSDGKLGLRGVVLDRQGAKLGKAMLAGFAQGLSGALGTAQSAVTSNASTGQTTSSITGTAALRASGLSGAQLAASQLAEFYLKEAQSVFPVIAIDAGRTGTIVFSNSTSLNWTNGDTQFVQQVTPTN